MNLDAADQIARAVFYEGYALYPYRASAVKNRQRFTFGGIYPRDYSEAQAGGDPWQMQTECLAVASPGARLELHVRFLHLTAREVLPAVEDADGAHGGVRPADHSVPSLEIGGRMFQSWQEAVERDVRLADLSPKELASQPVCHRFSCGARLEIEPLRDPSGQLVAFLRRHQAQVLGAIDVSAVPLDDGLFRLRITISNLTPSADNEGRTLEESQLHSLASTHTVLGIEGGEFVSLLDPPDQFREAAAGCQNLGTWPVLVGKPGSHDTLLSSRIILYDHPQIAPESPGALFDSTEIDEILSLRIMTLTDHEKREMAELDPHCRELLERVMGLSPEQMMNLHGAARAVQ